MNISMTTRLALPLFAYVLVLPCALAQGTSARLVGTVTDPSGATIAGVEVGIRNVATNFTVRVETNDQGDYTAANVPPGRYAVELTHFGFQRYERTGVELMVNQTARLDVQLSIGDTHQTVTVEGGAPLIESENASLGQVIGPTQVRELPLNGRNFVQLGQLVPGATQGPPQATTVRSRQGGQSLTINGQRQDQNNWMLDGVDNNAQLFGMVVVVPSIESLQEFKVQTSNYSAEFGRAAGAVVNVATKSGSNQFHGAAYEFLRNDNFDAGEYFAPASAQTGQRVKPPLAFNQFGAALGGRIKRDTTFFYINYEGKRTRRSTSTGSLVPTEAQRNGDYSGRATIYDPTTYSAATGLREAFPGNQVPSSRIHPAAAAIIKYIPLPNASDPARNFVTVAGSTDDSDQIPVRVDQRLGARQWLMGRFSYYNTKNATNYAFPLDADILQNRHRSFSTQHLFLISPALSNEFRIGYNRYHFGYLHETAGENYAEKLGLPSFAKGTIADGFPDIRIAGLARLGGNAAVPLDRIENTIQFTDTLSYVRGGHNLKMGGDLRRYSASNFQPQWGRGRYIFSGVFTAQAGRSNSDGVSDLLLGLPSQQRLSDVSKFQAQAPRNIRWSAFVQDDWKISPELTLNLGFRFERDGSWSEEHNQVGSFDAITGELVYARDYQSPYTLPFPHRTGDSNDLQGPTSGWSPRIGLAWRPRGTGDLVVRSAYGVFWSARTAENLLFAASVPPFAIDDTQNSGSIIPEIELGVSRLGNPEQLIPSLFSSAVLLYGSGRNPYTQQWNLTVEKQLGANIGVSLGYIGNHTVRLQRFYNGNAALPPGPGTIQPRRVWPLFGELSYADSDGSSTYHSLQARLERRFAKGLSLLSTYTWSKAIDNHGGEAETGAGIQDPSRRNLAKGRASFDLRQRFTMGLVYEPTLPGFRNRAANYVVQGWQVNSIATIQSGFPFTAVVSGDTVNAAAGTVHPDVASGNNGNLDGDARSIDRWFDTGAFSRPAAFTFGNAGRNILTAPGILLIDLGLARNFQIHEEHRVQFKVELFNSLNHANFGFPGATVGAANFGVIRSAARPREIQLALRYSF